MSETRPDTVNADPAASRTFYACFTDPVEGKSLEVIESQRAKHKSWLKDREADVFVAGPLLTESLDYSGSGLIVFRASSLAAAVALAQEDPMHSSGVRTFRVVPWRLNEGTIAVNVTLSDGVFNLG
jgi:hypothetical protein